MQRILVFSFSFIVLFSCNNPDSKTKSDSSVSSAADIKADPVVKPLTADASDSEKTKQSDLGRERSGTAKIWTYDTIHDNRNGAYTPSVYTKSVKGLYAGKLIVMKNHGVTNLIISVTGAKFNMDQDGKPIRAQFDGGDFETYPATKSNNGDPTMLFVDNSDKFIKKLKMSKRVTIEAEIVGNGKQTMEFDVEGLNWE